MKLELTLGGQEFLNDLKKTVERLEIVAKKLGGKEEPEADEEVVEDEVEESIEDAIDEDDEPVAKKKKTTIAKVKKLTSDDVNDACKAHMTSLIEAGKTGPEARKLVVKILKKKFDVESVTELEASQYGDAIKALKVK